MAKRKVVTASRVTQVTETPRPPCACGCGGYPKGPKSKFVPGHDARVHSARRKLSALRDDELQLKVAAKWDGPTDLPGLLLWLQRADVSLEEFQAFPAWQYVPADLKKATDAHGTAPVPTMNPDRPRRPARRLSVKDDASRAPGSEA